MDGRPHAPGSAIQPCVQQTTQSMMHIKRIDSDQQIIYQCLRKCSRQQIRESSRVASPRRMPLTYGPSHNGNTASPIAQRSLAEQLSTPPPGLTGATLDDSNPELHWPVMNRHFWHNIPINERTKADWDESMGVAFEGSCARGFVCHGTFHCIVIPHSGHEPVFYGSPAPHPHPPVMPDQVGHEFSIQLLNQVVMPMLDSSTHIILNPGQLIWLMEHTIVDNGWKCMPLGPFVIIVKEHNHYVLLDRSSLLYPHLAPADHLISCQSTWTAVQLPRALVNHPQVEEIRNCFQRA